MGSGQEKYPWEPTEDPGLGLMVESPYNLSPWELLPHPTPAAQGTGGTNRKVPHTHTYPAAKNQTVAAAQPQPWRAVLALSHRGWL